MALLPEPKTNRLTDVSALGTNDLPDCWQAVLAQPPASVQLASIARALSAEVSAGATIYPTDPWRALRLTPLAQVKVVILGQDPYHGEGQAQGLAFSVAQGCKTPPSLRNIFLEISQDPVLRQDGLTTSPNTDLSRWATQGVLLLNTSLTVRDGQAASHAKLGWQLVTDAIITAVAKRARPTVFMLWGAHAQAKAELTQAHGRQHLVLSANHPSPLSARRPPVPFLGCGHFGQANLWLENNGFGAIQW